MRACQVILMTLMIFSHGRTQWIQSSGPTTYRGVPMFALFSSLDSLIVGCYRGGAYLSTDDGMTWAERNNGFPRMDREYADVNDFILTDGSMFAATTNGVFRSTGFGQEWRESTVGIPAPSIANKLVHVTGLISIGTEWGVYSSFDNGLSWTADTVGLFRDQSNRITYVRALATLGSARFAGTANGVYVSASPGALWREANVGILRRPGFTFFPPVVCFLVSGTNIFAGTDYGGGVYFSTNQGATWRQVSNGLPVNLVGLIPPIRSMTEWNGYLYTSVQDYGICRSSDYGTSWALANSGLQTSGYAGSMRVVSGRVVAATFEGLFQTTNDGSSWTSVFARFPTFMSVNAFAETDTQLLVSAQCGRWSCDTSGIYRSLDGVSSWLRVGAPFQYANRFVTRMSELYACTRGIYLSSDNGATWISRGTGLLDHPVNDLTFQSSTMVAALGEYFAQTNYGGVFISTNGGVSWSAAGLSNQFVRTVASSGTYILASTTNFLASSGVYRTSNFGQTWDQVTSGLPSNSFVLSFLNRGIAIYAATSRGIFATTNSGSAWLPKNSGLPTSLLVVGMAQSSSALLCATTSGIYASTNEGESWRSVNTGFPPITDFYSVAIRSGRVFAGTNNGVWYRPLDEITGVSEQTALDFHLYQNYPNPFNPTTTIAFRIPTREFVSLRVFDVLGREVATLVNEQRDAGDYHSEFSADQHPSGVYFYRLRAGSFSQTRKLLLLK